VPEVLHGRDMNPGPVNPQDSCLPDGIVLRSLDGNRRPTMTLIDVRAPGTWERKRGTYLHELRSTHRCRCERLC